MVCGGWLCVCFLFKQKTAYEMRISDWSSDVCSSDLPGMPVDTPHWTKPFFLTLSKVAPALAAEDAANSAAATAANFSAFMFISCRGTLGAQRVGASSIAGMVAAQDIRGHGGNPLTD